MTMRGLVLLASFSSTWAFLAHSTTPARLSPPPTQTQLDAVPGSRREVLGWAFGLASSALMLPAGGAGAASNPALETFKGRSKSQSFYPVGFRYSCLTLASSLGVTTMATRRLRQSCSRSSSVSLLSLYLLYAFVLAQGKGMRDHESFDQLVAASNPALETVRNAALADLLSVVESTLILNHCASSSAFSASVPF
jgi:hypothetical protein